VAGTGFPRAGRLRFVHRAANSIGDDWGPVPAVEAGARSAGAGPSDAEGGRTLTRSLVRFSGSEDSPLSLVCIPWAGAGAAPFRSWAGVMPADTGLLAARFPGRESRIRERPIDDLRELVRVVSTDVGQLGGSVALFGHCSGAIVAFEVARALRQESNPPARLFLASQVAPHSAGESPPRDPSSDLRDELRRRGLTSELILANDELLALLRPAIEADLRLIDSYTYLPAKPLAIPITAFVARADPLVSIDRVEAWSLETTATFALMELTANHLFTGDAWNRLGRAVVQQRGSSTWL